MAEVAAGAWEEFLDVWSQLVERAALPGTIVVVEGDRDRASLRRLQVTGEIVPVHQGRPLSQVADLVARRSRSVILLTDWDTEGGQLARKLSGFLAALPLELDLDTRRRLARAVRGEVVHVEGLAGWARRCAERRATTIEAALAEAALGRRKRRPTG